MRPPHTTVRLTLYHTKTQHARHGLSKWHPALLDGTQPVWSGLSRSCVFPSPSEWQLSLPLCDMAQLCRSRNHIQENSKGKGKEDTFVWAWRTLLGTIYTPQEQSPLSLPGLKHLKLWCKYRTWWRRAQRVAHVVYRFSTSLEGSFQQLGGHTCYHTAERGWQAHFLKYLSSHFCLFSLFQRHRTITP